MNTLLKGLLTLRVFPALLACWALIGMLTASLTPAHTGQEKAGHTQAGGAQGSIPWTTWQQTGSLKVSYRPSGFDGLIEIKAQARVASTLSGFLLFILDTDNVPKWLDNAKSTRLISQISPTENIFITTFDRFGPIKARDMVIRSRFWQNPDLSVEIQNLDAAHAAPKQPGTIRLSIKQANWLVTPNADRSITITYTFTADAKGNLPSWLAEPMALKGIWKTMNNIKHQLPTSKWQNLSLPAIQEAWPESADGES